MTTIDLDHCSRLADLRPLAAPAPTLLAAARTSSLALLVGRQGYRADHLGAFAVPLPTAPADSVLPVKGRDDGRLDYTHFTVVMSRTRRLALFTAANLDGSASVSVPRGGDPWAFDRQIWYDALLDRDMRQQRFRGLRADHPRHRRAPLWRGRRRSEVGRRRMGDRGGVVMSDEVRLRVEGSPVLCKAATPEPLHARSPEAAMPLTRLIRIARRGYDVAAATRLSVNLVVLVDTSRSMDCASWTSWSSEPTARGEAAAAPD